MSTASSTLPIGDGFNFSGDPLAKPSPNTRVMSRASSSITLLLDLFLFARTPSKTLPTAYLSRVTRVSYSVIHRQSEVFPKPSKNVTHPLSGNGSGDRRAKPSRKTIVRPAASSSRLMASDACSSNTRRGRGEVGGEQELIAGYASSSSLQPGNVKDGVALKCFCEKYAICYMSKTDTNPNRLFFGCPLLKVIKAQCKFFLWVDDHIVRVRAGEATRGSGDGKRNHVEEHLGMDNLIAHVEERIVNIEKLLNKKSREAELRKKTREAATREMEASSTKSND
ncbi:hypothetical protein Ahy_B07g086931 [Arachis hypogaea]|uniref:GRF-type domain-containing protein n=1 Tax=Arachis hypogaea TaxID=3818 RepID=A0A444YAY7_ARAHY|nr:hypothetical protein Ahy_B07g086931 [Arachis hypogaea]